MLLLSGLFFFPCYSWYVPIPWMVRTSNAESNNKCDYFKRYSVHVFVYMLPQQSSKLSVTVDPGWWEAWNEHSLKSSSTFNVPFLNALFRAGVLAGHVIWTVCNLSYIQYCTVGCILPIPLPEPNSHAVRCSDIRRKLCILWMKALAEQSWDRIAWMLVSTCQKGPLVITHDFKGEEGPDKGCRSSHRGPVVYTNALLSVLYLVKD